jgi:hypothetical protein
VYKLIAFKNGLIKKGNCVTWKEAYLIFFYQNLSDADFYHDVSKTGHILGGESTQKKEWCPEAESNHRHGDFQSPALPTELSGHWESGAVTYWGRAKKARIKPAGAAGVKGRF